jgi:hypothetical protein
MPLRYLLDEHLRGPLWRAIQQHNAGSVYPIDTFRVGDPADLPLGSLDPDNLLWAERNGYVLVSNDKGTMPGHLARHLQAGHRSPGVYLLPRNAKIPQVVDYLVISAYTTDPALLQDHCEFIA